MFGYIAIYCYHLMMYKIAITGGPCAGKSTSLAYLKEKLSDFGFKVYTIPEISTLAILGGFNPRESKSVEDLFFIIKAIFNTQYQFEKIWEEYGGKIIEPRKVVILCDRGIMDVKAYIPNEYAGLFDEIAGEVGTNIVKLRDSYDGVIHLVTVADGAEQFYTLENNNARTSTLEQARYLDRMTRECWLGHSRLRIIDNSTEFEGKIKKTLSAICQIIGTPTPMEVERKFLVKDIDIGRLPPYQKIEIEQFYLTSENNEEIRLRRRGQNGSFVYFLTKKIKTDNPRVRQETEKIISFKEYSELLAQKDKTKNPIIKERICFLYKNQYFELDIFKEPLYCKEMMVLEIELTQENQEIEIPPFVSIEKEVTEDPQFSNSNLATHAPHSKV